MTTSTPETSTPPPTPAQLGYRMPAEWEPHEATWIAWPHNREDWPGKFAPVLWVYVEIVRHLSRFERGEHPGQWASDARRRDREARGPWGRPRSGDVRQESHRPGLAPRLGADLRRQGRRARRGEQRVGLVDWRFNAWAKYENHRHDNRIPAGWPASWA